MPGGRRRRHRLRHDRRPDPVHAAIRPARPAGASCGSRSSAPIPLSAGGYNRKIAPPPSRGSRSSRRSPRRTGSTRRVRGQLGAAARLARQRQPLHRGQRSTRPDRVWLFLHSGCRGVGNKIASTTSRSRKRLTEQWWITLPDPDLAYLVEGTAEFDALHPRAAVGAALRAAQPRGDDGPRRRGSLGEWIGAPVERAGADQLPPQLHRSRRRTSASEVWLSRKGAIRRDAGELGLIPGSMGTASYVVEGQGQPASLNSSPHGAGRQYSRSAARQTFTHEQLREAMAASSTATPTRSSTRSRRRTRTSTRSWRTPRDLVEVRHTLRQIVNVKGD